MVQEPVFKAITYLYSPRSNAGAVTPDDLALISNQIRQNTTTAINLGENATIVIHFDPTRFIPANGECHVLTGVPGTIISQSTKHVTILLEQGNCTINVEFFGGAGLFCFAQVVDGSDGGSSSGHGSSAHFTPPGTPAAAAGKNNNNEDDRDPNFPDFFDLPLSQLTVAPGANWSPL